MLAKRLGEFKPEAAPPVLGAASGPVTASRIFRKGGRAPALKPSLSATGTVASAGAATT
jgi:hypothetical protein